MRECWKRINKVDRLYILSFYNIFFSFFTLLYTAYKSNYAYTRTLLFWSRDINDFAYDSSGT